jgi:hypothetical protein
LSTAYRLADNGVLPERPLLLRWRELDKPLPVRRIRHPASRRPPGDEVPAWLPTGPRDRPFDFCGHLRRLCDDITSRCAELAYVDVPRLLFAVTQARNGRARGLQARVTPLRFRHGGLFRKRGGVTYQVQRYFLGDHEFLYLVNFCLPRFLDQTFDDKLVTIFHELYHISPKFDGDLRRHQGRYCMHSHSQRGYDREMAKLSKKYLAGNPDPALSAFLRLNFAQLERRHNGLVGIVVPRPKMIPIVSRYPDSEVRRQESAISTTALLGAKALA